MIEVEFIAACKNLKNLRQALGARLVDIPLGRRAQLGALIRLLGIGAATRAALGAAPIDVRPFVSRNLRRRELRYPLLFDHPLGRLIYRLVNLPRARIVASLIACHYQRNPKAKALIYNGFLIPDSLNAAIAERLGRSRLVVERGYFPGTLQYDRSGVNFDSSLPRDPAFYHAIAEDLPAEKPTQLARRPSKLKPCGPVQLPERFLFVPFQVPSDMQILAHSPWVRDMVHFHELIRALADRLPDRHFVIKEHPSFPRSLQKRVAPHARITFANHHETRFLIEAADGVITINSTVGMESLLLERKVITLGDAPYDIEGLVLKAGSLEELVSAIDRLDAFTVDARLRDAFLRYVYSVYLLRNDQHSCEDSVLTAFRARISQTDCHGRYLACHAAFDRG